MKATCAGCSREHAGTRLCPSCCDELVNRLHRVGPQVEDLEVALCRWARVGDGNQTGIRVRDAETPLAFNWSAAETLWLLHNTLQRWAFTIAQPRRLCPVPLVGERAVDPKDRARILPPRGRAVGYATWLTRHIRWIATHDDAGDLLDEIAYASRAADQCVDRPPDRAYAGPCLAELDDDQVCREDLYAPPKARTTRCRACDTEHDMNRRREWLLQSAEDYLLTATEASRALPGLVGRKITAAMIRGLAFRGKLAQHPPDPRVGKDAKGREQPLYKVAEILDVLLARDDAPAHR